MTGEARWGQYMREVKQALDVLRPGASPHRQMLLMLLADLLMHAAKSLFKDNKDAQQPKVGSASHIFSSSLFSVCSNPRGTRKLVNFGIKIT